jgi:hypothetical protein
MRQLVLLVIAGLAGYLAYRHTASSPPTKSKLTPTQHIVLTCAGSVVAALVGALIARPATIAAIGGWLGFVDAAAFEREQRSKRYGVGKHLWGVGAAAVVFIAALVSIEWCLAGLLGFLAFTTAAAFERKHYDDLWDIDASIWGVMTWFFFGVFLTSTFAAAVVLTVLPAVAAVVLYLRDRKTAQSEEFVGASWPRVDASEEGPQRASTGEAARGERPPACFLTPSAGAAAGARGREGVPLR